MSRETALASAQARKAAAAWRAHRADCSRCAQSARSSRGPGPCSQGAPLYLAHKSAQKELARNRELDKQPPPGQGALF
jgi:hypothetical protein